MTEYKLIFGLAATAVGMVQFLPYLKDIINGKTHPHAFSWFVWGTTSGIAFAAQFLKGGAAGSWATGFTSLFCILIFVLALFYGEKKIKKIDWACLSLALVAIVLWVITKNPLATVILITIADVSGYLPTLRKSIRKPYDETLISYAMSGLKWILSIFALGNFSFTVYLYPVAMIFANWLVVAVLLVRRRTILKTLRRSR